MESMRKKMYYRIKGTEMFLIDPDGTEAILQVRAASLCDDEWLIKHLRRRPGCLFAPRPRSPKRLGEKSKADAHPKSLVVSKVKGRGVRLDGAISSIRNSRPDFACQFPTRYP
jgi:hypothetical protein